MIRAGNTCAILNRVAAPAPSVVCLGDSITEDAFTQNSTSFNYQAQGWPAWLRHLSKQQIDMPYTNILGASGYTTSDIISEYLPTALGIRPNFAIILAGINDIQDGVSASAVKENYEHLATKFLQRNTIPVFLTILPTSTSMNADKREVLSDLNRYLMDLPLIKPGAVTVNTFRILADATSATGDEKSGVLRDNLHPNVNGAYLIAKEVWSAIETLIVPVENGFYSAADVYSDDNLTGNLLTNGLLDGTGGTAGGSGTSGDVADDWTIQNGTGAGNIGDLAVVAAKEDRTDGQNGARQKLTFSGTPDSIFTFFMLNGNVTTGVVPGETYYLECEYEVAAGSANLIQVGAQLAFNDGTSDIFRVRDFAYLSTANQNTYPDEKIVAKYRTEPWVAPEGTTTLRPILEFSFADGAAADAVISIDRVLCRRASNTD